MDHSGLSSASFDSIHNSRGVVRLHPLSLTPNLVRPTFPLFVERNLKALNTVTVGYQYQKIRLEFEGKWKQEKDDGCASEYVLLFRDKIRGFRTLNYIGEQLERSNQMPIHMEDEETLRVIHEQVFGGNMNAKVSFYMLCHVRVRDSTKMLPFTLIGSKRKIYQCKEVHVKQSPTSTQPRMTVDR